jgi:hypothetical protein
MSTARRLAAGVDARSGAKFHALVVALGLVAALVVALALVAALAGGASAVDARPVARALDGAQQPARAATAFGQPARAATARARGRGSSAAAACASRRRRARRHPDARGARRAAERACAEAKRKATGGRASASRSAAPLPPIDSPLGASPAVGTQALDPPFPGTPLGLAAGAGVSERSSRKSPGSSRGSSGSSEGPGSSGGSSAPVESPPSEPPASEPPASEPPASEPPASEPPVSEPPASEPPASEPPASEPPASEPPASEPPASEPPASEPPASEPPASEPPASEPPASEPPASEPPASEPLAPFRFFSPTSFWNTPLPADAPLDPSSAAAVGVIAEEVAHEEEIKKGPAINTTSWSVPIYTVPADQPTIQVTLVDAAKTPTLQSAWDAVPLPADAQPAAGSDEHLVVWQPSTDRLWEFWGLEDTAGGWQASWGGAMQSASSDSGAYSSAAWPGAQSDWGASASSLSIAGGLITLEDLAMGQINHALAIALPAVRAGVYAAPAQRTDGFSTEPLSIPEGAHLRLDPNLDLAALHLPRVTLMMAEAAQRYGIFVRDRAANVAFYAQDPTPTGTNPYAGAHGYFEGKSPSQLLAAFPWSHLQLLKMELHSSS